MKLLITLFSILFIANFQVKAQGKKITEWSISNILSGPNVEIDKLNGKVVAIEFWGVNCPPCIASLPHLASMDKKFRSKGLVIIGVHAQNASIEKILSTIQNGGVNYTIVERGRSPINFSGIPKLFIFDASGNMKFDGRPGTEAYKLMESLIKKIPYAILDSKKFKKLKKESIYLVKRKNLFALLNSLEKKKASSDETTAFEAAFLYEKIKHLLTSGKKELNELKENNSLKYKEVYAKYIKMFKGHPSLVNITSEYKKHVLLPEFKQEIAADKLYVSANKLMSKLKPAKKKRTVNLKDEKCRKKNKKNIINITKICDKILKKYPDTQSAKKAKNLKIQISQ
jgi:thiol-disulfide isomerase/thioredoxin